MNRGCVRCLFQERPGSVETFHVTHLQDQAIVRGQIGKFRSMRGIVSNGFFDQYMFAVREKRPCNLIVRVGRRGDGSGVHHCNKFF